MSQSSTTNRFHGTTASGSSRVHNGHVYGSLIHNETHHHYDTKEEAHTRVKNALWVSDPRVQRESLVTTKGQRVSGTCEWILEHAAYRDWIQGDISKLWISGGPGKGKTMIAIYLTEQLEDMAHSQEDTIVTYYFCRHQELNQHSAVNILRTLLWHLIDQKLILASPITTYFESADRAKAALASAETLWIMLNTILKSRTCGRVICVLDGLDECDEASKLFLASKMATEVSHRGTANFRIVLISRDIARLRRIRRIKLDPDHDDEIVKDIDTFIKDRVGELSDLEGFNTIRDEVQREISEKAAGTFLWVGFAMHELLKISTCSEILETLRSLPLGLDPIYRRMLEQIPVGRRDRAARALRWVMFAVRPLLLGELWKVLDLPCGTGLDWERCVRDEIKLCGPILTITRSSRSTVQVVSPSSDRDPRLFRVREVHDAVTLIHESANDFLAGLESSMQGSLQVFCPDPDDVHMEIVRECIRALDVSFLSLRLHERDPLGLEYRSTLDNYRILRVSQPTLFHYAVDFWVTHWKRLRRCDDDIWGMFKFFSQNSSTRRRWLKATEHKASFETSLETAAYLDILPWARTILRSAVTAGTVSGLQKSASSSLFWACKNGDKDMVKLLLDCGADPSNSDLKPPSPLGIAVENNYIEIVRLLIENGADANATSSEGQERLSILHVAIGWQNVELVQLLLDRGADANAMSTKGQNPLHAALAHVELARDISMKMIQSLIKNGADVNATFWKDGTPLHNAVRHGDIEMIQSLLDSGAEVNRILWIHGTPLHIAARHGDIGTARLLLQSGSNVNLIDRDGNTALDVFRHRFYEPDEGDEDLADIFAPYRRHDHIGHNDAVSQLLELFIATGARQSKDLKSAGSPVDVSVDGRRWKRRVCPECSVYQLADSLANL